MFDAVTKYNVNVDTLAQLPHLLRQAFREAMTGTPGPVHLDLLGYQGQGIEEAEADLEVLVEEPFARIPPYRPTPDAAHVADATSEAALALSSFSPHAFCTGITCGKWSITMTSMPWPRR